MIPRIQTGSSFKGAALYYLHDKRREGERERLTTDRVAWAHSFNTLEEEPEQVIAEMQHTAMRQQALKLLSGNRLDGRPTERTVMTVALAWSPEQSPTKEQMIEASQSYLKHMGWQDHQVLLVAHNDTKHPHVHLIVNRIHPETGMTLDSAWAKTRSQRWALAYEREQGRIFCQAREAKYGRAQGRDAPHMSYAEWKTWQEISKENVFDSEFRYALQGGEWAALKQGQKQERIGFWKETGRMRQDLRATLREEVRQEFAPQWQIYSAHKAERLERAKLYDQETRRALRELRKQLVSGRRPGARADTAVVARGADGKTFTDLRRVESAGIERIKERQKAYHARLREDLADLRRGIFSRQKVRLEELAVPALNKLDKDRMAEFKNELLPRHRAEKAELRQDQKEGERRYDALRGMEPPSPAATPLTPEQAAGYVAHAREFTKVSDAQFEKTRRETTDRDKQSGEERQTAKELTERAVEKREKDRVNEGKRQAGLEWYLAKRKQDRARDRGDGGRDR